MYEDSHLEAQYEDTISEVAQADDDYWNDKYDGEDGDDYCARCDTFDCGNDDEEMNDDE